MQKIAELFQENGLFILRFVLPIIISLAAFILSFIVYKQNKKRLDVTFEPDLLKINSIYTNNISIKMDKGSYIAFIKVVNPSPSDIGYFDLRVFDVNKPTEMLATYNELILRRSDLDATYFEYESIYGKSNLNAPKSNYGVFKSNSFTRLDIPFTLDRDTKEVIITFKVAIKVRKNNPYAYDRKNFKFYASKYIISEATPSYGSPILSTSSES